jgi:hypothetical protein
MEWHFSFAPTAKMELAIGRNPGLCAVFVPLHAANTSRYLSSLTPLEEIP